MIVLAPIYPVLVVTIWIHIYGGIFINNQLDKYNNCNYNKYVVIRHVCIRHVSNRHNNTIKGDIKMPESTDRGALTEAVFYILLALFKPTHGYGIMKFIRTITNDRVILGSGTLYGALSKLIKNNWIKIENIQNDDRKCYIITKTGKKIVNNEIVRLKELFLHGNRITEGDIDEEITYPSSDKK